MILPARRRERDICSFRLKSCKGVVSEINNTNWKSGKKYGNIQKRSNPAEATHEERKIASLKRAHESLDSNIYNPNKCSLRVI